MNRKYILLAIGILAGPLAFTQTPVAKLKAVGDHYRSLRHYSLNVSVGMYSAENAGTPERRMHGYVHVSGHLGHSLFDGKESITGSDFVLVADHANHTVYYAPQKQAPQKPMADGLKILDSVYLSRYTVSETKISETELECKLSPKKTGEFKSITIRLDMQNRILKEITYLYAPAAKYPKVVVRYTDFNPTWQPDKEHYTEKKFLTGRQKNAHLQTAYASYQLINSFTYDPKKNLIEQ